MNVCMNICIYNPACRRRGEISTQICRVYMYISGYLSIYVWIYVYIPPHCRRIDEVRGDWYVACEHIHVLHIHVFAHKDVAYTCTPTQICRVYMYISGYLCISIKIRIYDPVCTADKQKKQAHKNVTRVCIFQGTYVYFSVWYVCIFQCMYVYFRVRMYACTRRH